MKYLIRHAEKIDSSIHSKLSKKGELDSINYGKKLLKDNIKITQIISSPMERCIQTSKSIAIGLEQSIPIIDASELGDPGVYISDDKKAMDIFNKHTLLEVMNFQLSKTPLQGFYNIDFASNNLKIFFNSHKDNTLFISHDAIIIPYINWDNNKESLNDSDLIEYLFTIQI